MIGDEAHRKLLEGGWRWTPNQYVREVHESGHAITLTPGRPGPLPGTESMDETFRKDRRSIWWLRMEIGRDSIRVARFPNLMEAAKFVAMEPR
jgi:hypothetical protein